MYALGMPRRGAICILLCIGVCGCAREQNLALDPAVARRSVQTAMQAWVDGKTPDDVKPIIVGDPAWRKGRKLAAFEILTNEEKSDGANLHIQVVRKFSDVGEEDGVESKVIYIVSTSPAVTIFPQ